MTMSGAKVSPHNKKKAMQKQKKKEKKERITNINNKSEGEDIKMRTG